MRAYKYNDTIEVLGASFNGVKEMIEYARKKEPKDGVYVGEDSDVPGKAAYSRIGGDKLVKICSLSRLIALGADGKLHRIYLLDY
ncbi:MAG: hypothetical protein ACI3ZP_06690 [Candidatus Cryptobacteroides sp.]